MSNSCGFTEQEIGQYISCELPDQQARLIEEHVESCGDCQSRLVEQVGAGNSPAWLRQFIQGQTFTDFEPLERRESTLITEQQKTVSHTQQNPLSNRGTTSAALDDSLDDQLDSYAIVRCLAKGGMSEVFEAFDTVMQRRVALKLMRDAGSAHLSLQRVMTEAQALARLSHPQIVSVYDVIIHDDGPVLVLEYVDGVTLDCWQNKQLVDPKLAAMIVRDLAEAVAHAHERGVVHRDLKPGNVMLKGSPEFAKTNQPDADLQLKITDFGISRLVDRVSWTQTGEILGTPAYMAPEQTTGRTDRLGPAVDIYGLGAILYELLTGRPPFASTDPIVTLALVRDSEPIPPKALRPELPIDLNTICLKCLEKRPDQRFDSTTTLATELTAFLEDRPISTRPIGPLRYGWRWCRRNRGLTAAFSVAIFALLSTLLGAILFAQMQSQLRHEAEAQRIRAEVAEKNWQNIAERRRHHFALLLATVVDFVYPNANEPAGKSVSIAELQMRGSAIVARIQDDWFREVGPPSQWNSADIDQLFRYNHAVARTVYADTVLPWLDQGEQALTYMESRGTEPLYVNKVRAALYEARGWHAVRKRDADRIAQYTQAALDAWVASWDLEPSSVAFMNNALTAFSNLQSFFTTTSQHESYRTMRQNLVRFVKKNRDRVEKDEILSKKMLERLTGFAETWLADGHIEETRELVTEATGIAETLLLSSSPSDEIRQLVEAITALEAKLPQKISEGLSPSIGTIP